MPAPYESKTRLENNLRPLYLDAQATTPLDPRVLDEMLPFQIGSYGNPHSRSHQYGWESEAAVERARAEVASLVKADPKEIIFTSGATESNNIAIKGTIGTISVRKTFCFYLKRMPIILLKTNKSELSVFVLAFCLLSGTLTRLSTAVFLATILMTIH